MAASSNSCELSEMESLVIRLKQLESEVHIDCGPCGDDSSAKECIRLFQQGESLFDSQENAMGQATSTLHKIIVRPNSPTVCYSSHTIPDTENEPHGASSARAHGGADRLFKVYSKPIEKQVHSHSNTDNEDGTSYAEYCGIKTDTVSKIPCTFEIWAKGKTTAHLTTAVGNMHDLTLKVDGISPAESHGETTSQQPPGNPQRTSIRSAKKWGPPMFYTPKESEEVNRAELRPEAVTNWVLKYTECSPGEYTDDSSRNWCASCLAVIKQNPAMKTEVVDCSTTGCLAKRCVPFRFEVLFLNYSRCEMAFVPRKDLAVAAALLNQLRTHCEILIKSMSSPELFATFVPIAIFYYEHEDLLAHFFMPAEATEIRVTSNSRPSTESEFRLGSVVSSPGSTMWNAAPLTISYDSTCGRTCLKYSEDLLIKPHIKSLPLPSKTRLNACEAVLFDPKKSLKAVEELNKLLEELINMYGSHTFIPCGNDLSSSGLSTENRNSNANFQLVLDNMMYSLIARIHEQLGVVAQNIIVKLTVAKPGMTEADIDTAEYPGVLEITLIENVYSILNVLVDFVQHPILNEGH